MRTLGGPSALLGTKEPKVRLYFLSDAFRARMQWKDSGRPREGYGPRRPDEEAAKDNLETQGIRPQGREHCDTAPFC